jgi:acyl carrier protein
MSDIAERVRMIVVEQLVIDLDEVVDSARFADDLGADSLDIVELAIKFEREFSFEISDDVVGSILTVGDAVRNVELHAFAWE